MGDYLYSVSPTSEENSKSVPMRVQSNQTYLSIDREEQQERWRRRWALFLFSLTTILLFADQNLMAPNLTAIAEEFNLDDAERDRKLGGDISLAFFIIGAPASFFVGLLADTGDRAKIFGWTVFIGETACFLTYFVQTYAQLYVCRAVTGFSVGGALPIIYSILGDLFKAEDRHIVSAVVSGGLGAGISLGQAVAGYMGPVYGWRLPFIVISVPAIVCAVVVYFTVKDPERGVMEQSHLDALVGREDGRETDNGEVALVSVSSRTSLVQNAMPSQTSLVENGTSLDDDDGINDETNSQSNDSRDQPVRHASESISSWKHHLKITISLLSTKTVALSLIQGAPGCIPWGIINVFLNDYLSEDRGYSVQEATTILMCFSLGYGLGLLVGGAGGKWLYKIDIRLPALLAGGTAIMGCFPLWFLINRVDSSTPFYIAASSAMITGIGRGPTGAIIKATLTNVTLPRARGQAFAMFNLFDDFGKGLGPYFVSRLIVQAGGRTRAFNIGVSGWIICGLANLAIFFTVAHDEQVVQRTLAAQLSASK
mmetsp:Transcript_15976/g.33013  ORF Transcript_15976/g.33013 Transcript_15976/m.33013 type:complete len:540 (+) Transcript_15976:157-1776(+)